METKCELIFLNGKKFGEWEVLKRAKQNTSSGAAMWTCQCNCGVIKDIGGFELRRGYSKSCGCLKRTLAAERCTIHELSKINKEGKKHPLYKSWEGMKYRCYNKKSTYYRDYGGRGIKVCERWLEFNNFYLDMGDTYKKGLTLGRIHNNKGYYLSNCRWETAEEQQNNRRNCHYLEIDGITLTITQWARHNGINPSMAFNRIARGWNKVEAVRLQSKSKRIKDGT